MPAGPCSPEGRGRVLPPPPAPAGLVLAGCGRVLPAAASAFAWPSLCGPLCPLLFLPGHSPRDRGPTQVIQIVTPPDPPFNHTYKHPFSKRSHGHSSAEDVSFGEPPLSPRWPWTSTCRASVGPVRHRLPTPGRPARSRSSPSEPQLLPLPPASGLAASEAPSRSGAVSPAWRSLSTRDGRAPLLHVL